MFVPGTTYMMVDDDHLKSTDVKMGRVADAAKLVQPLHRKLSTDSFVCLFLKII